MGNIKRKTNRAGKTIVSFSDSSGKPIELVLRNDNLELRINGRYKNTLINDVTLAALIGDIDTVLGILTGDISGDIDLITNEMQEV